MLRDLIARDLTKARGVFYFIHFTYIFSKTNCSLEEYVVCTKSKEGEESIREIQPPVTE